jgi:hypothetical protein
LFFLCFPHRETVELQGSGVTCLSAFISLGNPDILIDLLVVGWVKVVWYQYLKLAGTIEEENQQ